MGLFKSPAESIRSAMRRSYEKHHKKAMSRSIGSEEDSPHIIGMYGALASRNAVCGFPTSEPVVWAELGPFLQLSERDALEALCHYAAWRESQNQLDAGSMRALKEYINIGVTRFATNEPEVLISVLKFDLCLPWMQLVTNETGERVDELLSESQ